MKDLFHNMYSRNYWNKKKQKKADAIATAKENELFESDGRCPITGLLTKNHSEDFAMAKKYCNVFARVIKTVLIMSISANSQSVHLDASVGANSRLHSVGALGVTYQSVSRFEMSAIAAFENKHNMSAGLIAGIKTGYYPEDGWLFSAGASYQFYTTAAKTELKNSIQPVIAARVFGNYGFWEFRYQANSFNVHFGYRFLNHNK